MTHKALHTPKTEPHHGTMTSYIIGFALSLIFTFISYYLVVNKTLSNSILTAVILGFAVLQMIVQMVFFLHLGREKKPHWNLFFLASTVSIILVVVGGSLWIMGHLYHGMSSMNMTDKVVAGEAIYQVNGKQPGTCSGQTGSKHSVMLMDNVATPSHINARLCDTLVVMNHDDTTRNIVFGSGAKAETYAGQTGPSVRTGHSEVIVLTEAGTYTFHDKEVEKLSVHFTVEK
jgi:cytochrome o ubiquinol oxidase operon protein cyoD